MLPRRTWRCGGTLKDYDMPRVKKKYLDTYDKEVMFFLHNDSTMSAQRVMDLIGTHKNRSNFKRSHFDFIKNFVKRFTYTPDLKKFGYTFVAQVDIKISDITKVQEVAAYINRVLSGRVLNMFTLVDEYQIRFTVVCEDAVVFAEDILPRFDKIPYIVQNKYTVVRAIVEELGFIEPRGDMMPQVESHYFDI